MLLTVSPKSNLNIRQSKKAFRSGIATMLENPLETRTFQDSFAKLFNELGPTLPIDNNVRMFTESLKEILTSRAKNRLGVHSTLACPMACNRLIHSYSVITYIRYS